MSENNQNNKNVNEQEQKQPEKRMELRLYINSFEESALCNYTNVFVKAEEELQRVKEKKLGKAMYPKITIRISSYGGDTFVADAVISMMENLKKLGVEINTEACGFAYSSGMLVFIHGMKRTFINKDFTFLMWHQAWLAVAGKMTDVDTYLAFNKTKIMPMHEKYLFNNTKVTKEILANRCFDNKDWYIDYREAKKLGIVTE